MFYLYFLFWVAYPAASSRLSPGVTHVPLYTYIATPFRGVMSVTVKRFCMNERESLLALTAHYARTRTTQRQTRARSPKCIKNITVVFVRFPRKG